MKRMLQSPPLRAGLALSAAAVVALHLRLLWSRIADGSLLDPLVAGRWLASVAVIFAAVVLRRRGIALLRGRAALVVWLLVILLHGVGMVPAGPASSLATAPTDLLLLASPLGLSVAMVLFAAAALGGATAAALQVGGRRPVRAAISLVSGPGRWSTPGPRAPPR